ncbi:MAG: DUF3035 domain-containing protein [Sphingobium sp.]|nr:DUF3035 domain-containing protein [Sphingobium sp.]
MRKLMIATCLTGTLLALSACGSRGVLNRDRPDEMAVTRQAPLVIPPDFSLVPPAPGAAPTATPEASRQAMEAMFGGPSARSGSESATLQQAGRAQAEPGIRSSVGDPSTNVVDKGATTRDILVAPEGDGQFGRAATGN